MANEQVTEKISVINYDTFTKKVSITIRKTTSYQTVDRYVTQNYVKYPIYSAVKYKSKDTEYQFILSNTELESGKFSTFDYKVDIIDYLVKNYNFSTLPSWYQRIMIDRKINEARSISALTVETINKEVDSQKKLKNRLGGELLVSKDKLSKLSIKKNKLSHKISKKFCLFRKLRTNKLDKINVEIMLNEDRISNNKQEIDKIDINIVKLNAKINKVVTDSRELIYTLKQEYQSIHQLSIDSIVADNLFMPLCDALINIKSSDELCGCYVIHNKENHKYYVGQSKNIGSRLNQHFKKNGEPNNIIFAKDYYQAANPDNLFEVKIINCSGKDALDRTEKELIEKYDAFRNGYNGTGGNK